jgi:hypothetical protein
MGKQGKKHIGFLIADLLDMLNGVIKKVGSIEFDTTNGAPSGEGILHWNSDDGTLQVGMPGGDVNLQIGQEQTLRAKNVSGDTLANGTAISVAGGAGNNITVDVATRNVLGEEIAGAIGLTTEEIDNNQFGYITTFGLVRDVDTSDWPAGTRLFLSDTDGVITDDAPLTFGRNILVGISVVQHVSQGVILVFTFNAPFMPEISGVRITNPQDGDVLTYVAATGFWINQAPV